MLKREKRCDRILSRILTVVVMVAIVAEETVMTVITS